MPRKSPDKQFHPLPWEVVINMAANEGYILRVGCKQFIYTNPADLLEALSPYLVNPEKAIANFKKYEGVLSTEIQRLQQASYDGPYPTDRLNLNDGCAAQQAPRPY